MFPYVDVPELKAYLAKLLANKDDDLESLAWSMSTWLDEETGRSFQLHEDQARETVIGKGGRIDVVDLRTQAALVEIDEDGDFTFGKTVTTNSFRCYPRTFKNGTPADRWQTIEPVMAVSDSGSFVEGRAVRITADWGWVEGDDNHPAELARRFCFMLAARYFKRREAPLNLTTMPAYGFRRMIEKDEDAFQLLELLAHPRFRRRIQ